MRLKDRLHHVAHWGYLSGLVAWISLRLRHPQDTTFADIGIGFAVGIAVTLLLSLTRVGDHGDESK